jgi:hypothetical protein
MSQYTRRILIVFFVSTVVALSVVSAKDPSPPKKKVLAELYTSQGCDMCPKAEQLFGSLAQLDVDTDRIVPVAFHVDYFNSPWKDPFSDNAFSKRQYEYSLIYQRENQIDNANYLYFTPMLMVDGRQPMLGSDQTKSQAALRRSLAESPAVSIDTKLTPDPKNPRSASLSVSIKALSPVVAGRELLVGAAVWEDPVTTKVASGENAGKTLREHFAVRKFVYEKATLANTRARASSFSLNLVDDQQPARSGIAVFVQDWKNGRVYQADRLDWFPKSAAASASVAR